MTTLTDKPWLAGPAPKLQTRPGGPLTTAVNFVLAVVTSLFMLFCLAMIIRSQTGDWRPLTESPWQPLYDPAPLWRNTIMLVLSSVLLVVGIWAANRQAIILMRGALVLSVGLAVGFLAGQYGLWQLFLARGFNVSSTPAASFFYILTGLHGLHLLVGILLWGGVVPRMWHRPESITIHRLRIFSRYWHYLLGLWLVLFALLTSSPATYQALAALCGVEPVPLP